MNEKKDLDRLFQEKFKDFEVAPPEFVWENIQEILQEKKKRRVIPIWFKLSGVAALLILSGLLATLFFNDTDNPVNTNPVVIDNNTASPADALKASPDAAPANAAIPSATGKNSNNNSANGTPALQDGANTTAVATANDNTNNTNNKTSATVNGVATKNNSGKVNTTHPAANNNYAVAHQSTATTINKTNGKRTRIDKNLQQGNAVVYEATQPATTGSATQTSDVSSTASNNSIVKNETTNDALAAAKLRNDAKNFASNPNSTINKANRDNSNTTVAVIEDIAARVNRDAALDRNANIATVKNGTITNTNAQGIAENNTKSTQGVNPTNAESNTIQKSNVIIDKNIPATDAVAQTVTDTTATVVPENELEKLLQEKLNGKKDEDKALAENKPKERWVLKPQVAPVFYNSLTSGSPINEQFAGNSKSYDNDLSFGLGVNYAVTDRISIRSGINSVNLSYATNDIAFYASLNNATSNIGTSKTANIVVQNAANVPDVVMIDGQPTQAVSGSMLQKTGYIEIPLEMSYSVVNKKFGIDVIGGVSSLFLNQNNVSVVSNTGLSTQVGEAQNLNNLHFSTNIGLGFKYHFWDSFQINFEPMFKYQLNAYSENSGNFKPYFIGLYSGVSFSF